jgi:hypothetical protein
MFHYLGYGEQPIVSLVVIGLFALSKRRYYLAPVVYVALIGN